jgi:hypothetical protein
VIKTLLAKQHQIGNGMFSKKAIYPGGPILGPPREVNRARTTPKQPIPKVQIDPMDLVPSAAQASRDFRKKRRYRTLQKEKAPFAIGGLRMKHARTDWHPEEGRSTFPNRPRR